MLRFLLCALALLGAMPAAMAAAYRVDLIVFLDQNFQRGAPAEPAQPAGAGPDQRAIALDDAARLRAAGIELLAESDSPLDEVWNRLRNSKRFKPLARLAWVQRDPPAENGPSLRLRHGQALRRSAAPGQGPAEAQAIYPLDGTVRLALDRYLHLDVDLQYAQYQDGDVAGYRLRESRRLRSGELHHLDSPRFGVIGKITREE